jgi:hypothetical protein
MGFRGGPPAAAGVRVVTFNVPYDAAGLSDDANGYTLCTPGPGAPVLPGDLVLDITVEVLEGFDGTTPMWDIGQAPLVANLAGIFRYWTSQPTAVDESNIEPDAPYFESVGLGDQAVLPSLDWSLADANYNLRFIIADKPLVTWVTDDGYPPTGSNDPGNNAGLLRVTMWVSTANVDPANPGSNPVLSVNGETGDVVVGTLDLAGAVRSYVWTIPYDAAGLSDGTGYAFTTPNADGPLRAGDQLLDVRLRISTPFECAADARFDFSQVSAAHPNGDYPTFWSWTSYNVVLTNAGTPTTDGDYGVQWGLYNGSPVSALLPGLGYYGWALTTYLADGPLKCWVTASGQLFGDDPELTAGELELVFIVCTPQAAG